MMMERLKINIKKDTDRRRRGVPDDIAGMTKERTR